MKKSLCILTILLATFFVGLFVSCSAVEELKNFYLDKWYQYNPEKVGNLQIPIGADDDSEGSATTENISIADNGKGRVYILKTLADRLRCFIGCRSQGVGEFFVSFKSKHTYRSLHKKCFILILTFFFSLTIVFYHKNYNLQKIYQ